MTEQVPAYRVLSVADDMMYDQHRGAVRAKRVNLQFADGQTTHIQIPLDQYGPDSVEQMATAAVFVHEQVMELQGQPVTKSAPTSQVRPYRP